VPCTRAAGKPGGVRDERDGGSRCIDDQARRCCAFAEALTLAVVGVFEDAAESGAHLERADLQRLLTEARSSRCRFQAVLVDDLSRLSRDLGNTSQIVFRYLATDNDRVIDISTRMACDSAGARIQLGVRTETPHGLEVSMAERLPGPSVREVGAFTQNAPGCVFSPNQSLHRFP
jgi:hypothetical protein